MLEWSDEIIFRRHYIGTQYAQYCKRPHWGIHLGWNFYKLYGNLFSSSFKSSKKLKCNTANWRDKGRGSTQAWIEALTRRIRVYVSLGDQQTFPTVISSQITSDQESKLLTILKSTNLHLVRPSWT